MVDHKQHLFTVMVTFLSLAVGIFIGNALLGDDLLIAQQQEVIQRLEQNYVALQGEHRRLQQEMALIDLRMESSRQLEEALLPLLLNERTFNNRVALVNTSGKPLDPFWESMLSTFSVEVATTSSFNRNITFDQLVPVTLPGHGQDQDQDWGTLVDYLAGAITGTRVCDLAHSMAGQGLLSFSGDPLAGVDLVLLFGGRGSNNDSLDLERQLITAWQGDGIRVIILETTSLETSGLEHLLQEGVSYISHADTFAGQLSLLYLLETMEDGYFGPQETARQGLFPEGWVQGLVLDGD